MSRYIIKYDWAHSEGHIATSNWGLVSAKNKRDAILKFKESNMLGVGKYIKED